MDTTKSENKKNFPWKVILKLLTNTLVAIVFFLAFLMILSNFNVGGLRVLTVLTGSMSPTICTGSVIFVTPSGDYKEKDIITFRAQGEKEFVTHRIVEVDESMEEPSYRTKGDANDASDSYKVPKAAVAGKVRFSVPLLGYILEFIKKPFGLILLIIIPATIIIYSEIQKIIKEVKKIRERRKKSKEKKRIKEVKETEKGKDETH